MTFYESWKRKGPTEFSILVQEVLQKKYEKELSELKDEDGEILDEKKIMKRVGRAGKIVRKAFSTRKNAKIKDGREVTTTSAERLRRSKGAKKGAKKKKARKSVINLRRKKTMKKTKYIK